MNSTTQVIDEEDPLATHWVIAGEFQDVKIITILTGIVEKTNTFLPGETLVDAIQRIFREHRYFSNRVLELIEKNKFLDAEIVDLAAKLKEVTSELDASAGAANFIACEHAGE